MYMYLLFETSPGWLPGWRGFFFNSIWWGALSSNVFTICAVYWSLGRRGYFRVSNGVLVITCDSEVIMFSPCVFVCLFVCLFVCVCLCLSRCLSGQFNYEGLVPHKLYFAGTLLGMSSCASYVSRTHDVIDDVTRSQSRSNFDIDISPVNIWARASIKSSKCRKC